MCSIIDSDFDDNKQLMAFDEFASSSQVSTGHNWYIKYLRRPYENRRGKKRFIKARKIGIEVYSIGSQSTEPSTCSRIAHNVHDG